MRESYAALLRRHAANIRRMSETIGWPENEALERDVRKLEALASLLERVTPEMVNDLRLDIMVMTGCDEPAVGTKDALSTLRALAAGPQAEEGGNGES